MRLKIQYKKDVVSSTLYAEIRSMKEANRWAENEFSKLLERVKKVEQGIDLKDDMEEIRYAAAQILSEYQLACERIYE